MKLPHVMSALFVFVLVLPLSAVGQDDAAAENTVVASKQSIADLRADFYKAEKNFYSRYNKLNDDDLYDVRCTYEAPTGSRIRQQFCRPKFLARALSRGEINSMSGIKDNPALAELMNKYVSSMNALIAEDPELQAAANRFGEARTRFQAQEASENK